MKNTKSISARELRTILFNVPDETITVKELRHQLFNIDNQDAKYLFPSTLFEVMINENKVEQSKEYQDYLNSPLDPRD